MNITLISRRRRRRRMLLGACLTLAVAGSAVVGAGTAAAASPKIQRVCGKPKLGVAACMSERLLPQRGKSFLSTFTGYGPSDLQRAYALPSSTLGSGRTVAIVDAYDLPTAESDLATYRSRWGLPPCTTANGCFRKINQTGGTAPPAADSAWGEEIALDIDMVSAICPLCKILLVEANSTNLNDMGAAVNQAASQGAVAISNSWGAQDGSYDSAFDQAYFKHPGIAVTASTGDSGYGAAYPAASPYVTAVGGTTLVYAPLFATWRGGWYETSWAGTGSGCSSNEAKPSFQHDTGCTGRTIADVSAVANPATGVAVYDSYQEPGWLVLGGTSAASPIVASVYAMATRPGSGVYPVQYPYARPSLLNDIFMGYANGTCSPVYLCNPLGGYDGPTGLGTPNGVGAFGP